MQGFNMGRYIPPDLEGTSTGNKIHKRRAPGTLRKYGTQTVRFELPYAVWCHTCNPHAIIGQGVRFNAEKKKIGYYHSTPIWNFKIKHTACGGFIEIKTDPKNTAYVVVSGGKARDYGEDKEGDLLREGEAGVPILTAEERERRREDAFASLEGKKEDADAAKKVGKRIEELYVDRQRHWDDTYDANRRIRAGFRRERKERKREEEANEKLKERLGTDIELLAETEEDVRRARLVIFDRSEPPNTISKPFLRTKSRTAKPSGKDTARDALQKQLVGNTRAATNPFGGPSRRAEQSHCYS